MWSDFYGQGTFWIKDLSFSNTALGKHHPLQKLKSFSSHLCKFHLQEACWQCKFYHAWWASFHKHNSWGSTSKCREFPGFDILEGEDLNTKLLSYNAQSECSQFVWFWLFPHERQHARISDHSEDCHLGAIWPFFHISSWCLLPPHSLQ